ncbi:MAG: MFS transporter [Nitrospinae bacterium]|nr:MFS transporter [Nitrospinota bacterium]
MTSKFTPSEIKGTVSLAIIISLRLAGIFLLLPVFALYAAKLEGSTPFLIGMALGSYGISQLLLQIPFGMLSDKYGRKVVLVAGLFLFAIGSVVCAQAEDIYVMLAGRVLQGSGAVASVIMAYIADITADENRLKAMTLVGVSIGITFAASLVVSPYLAAHFGVPGIFLITACLIIIAILYLVFFMKDPEEHPFRDEVELNFNQVGNVLKVKDLLVYDYGIFFIHLSLTATFVSVPFYLEKFFAVGDLWEVYISVFMISAIFLPPVIIFANRKNKEEASMMFCSAVMCVSFLFFAFSAGRIEIVYGGLVLFFIGFNALSALLPSGVSKRSNRNIRGTSLGIYNTSEFLGTFVGGAIGGVFLGYNPPYTFFILFFLGLVSIYFISRLQPFKVVENHSQHDKTPQ